jgi:hypothetical protein
MDLIFYGAVKGTAYKWLDTKKMVQLIQPKNQILKIKYFTAWLMLGRKTG